MANKSLTAELDGKFRVTTNLLIHINEELDRWNLHKMDTPFRVNFNKGGYETERIEAAIDSLKHWKRIVESEHRMLEAAGAGL